MKNRMAQGLLFQRQYGTNKFHRTTIGVGATPERQRGGLCATSL